MPELRKATWALVIWTAAMIVWMATFIFDVGSLSCVGESGLARTVCDAGASIGMNFGVSFVVIVWFIGFGIFGLIWLTTRPKFSQ